MQTLPEIQQVITPGNPTPPCVKNSATTGGKDRRDGYFPLAERRLFYPLSGPPKSPDLRRCCTLVCWQPRGRLFRANSAPPVVLVATTAPGGKRAELPVRRRRAMSTAIMDHHKCRSLSVAALLSDPRFRSDTPRIVNDFAVAVANGVCANESWIANQAETLSLYAFLPSQGQAPYQDLAAAAKQGKPEPSDRA
jgi:hypothetical protein